MSLFDVQTLSDLKNVTLRYYDHDLSNWACESSLSFNSSHVPFEFKEIVEYDSNFPWRTQFKENIFSLVHSNKNCFKSPSLIPPGLLFVKGNFLVFERPPTHKLVNSYSVYLDQIQDRSKTRSYYLPIPWQIYIVEFDPSNYRTCSVKMFFTESSFYSEDQPLYLPPIPNFYVNGQLCRPFFSSMDDIDRYTQDISGIIHSAYDWVWSSNFNLDLTETISSIYTQKNPIQIQRGITDLNYRQYRISMDIIDDTYSHWESLELSEVTSFVWPNPAYNQTFDADAEEQDHHELFVQWCEENEIEIEDEEDYENYYNSESFTSSIPNSRKIRKSFKDIFNYSFRNSYFFNFKNVSIDSLLVSYINSKNT